MTVPDSSETAQTEGEGPDGPDIARSKKQSVSRNPSNLTKPQTNGTTRLSPNPVQPSSNSTMSNGNHENSIPLPPPEAHSYYKEPGITRGALEKLVLSSDSTPRERKQSGPLTPSSVSSISPPESEYSLPSTRPPSRAPSQAPSRAGSFSESKASALVTQAAIKEAQSSTKPKPPAPTKAPSISSVHSDGGHKFTLKDLLANGPKLTRRSSARSTGSSKKSDSDGGGSKSQAGDSVASLSKKYGVCEKVPLGKGATSVVRLAHKWDRTEERLYAVKEFRKRRKNETEKEYVKKLTAEFCISSTLHHVNIVETVDLVQDDQQKWCEVMEFCPGGDLYAAIKKGGMSPSEVECCFKQILRGVGYLHSQGVAHRDLKPENLFFDTKGHLKIGDYGASTVYRLPWETTVHMSTGLCGSEPYIAPELFLGKPYDARFVDVWACAIVYYCLHFSELPWRAAQLKDELYASYAAACASPKPEQSSCPPTINNLSPRLCRPLIRKMLEPDPKQRYSIEQVLAHPWVESIEVCYDVAKPSHMHVHARSLAQAQINLIS